MSTAEVRKLRFSTLTHFIFARGRRVVRVSLRVTAFGPGFFDETWIVQTRHQERYVSVSIILTATAVSSMENLTDFHTYFCFCLHTLRPKFITMCIYQTRLCLPDVYVCILFIASIRATIDSPPSSFADQHGIHTRVRKRSSCIPAWLSNPRVTSLSCAGARLRL